MKAKRCTDGIILNDANLLIKSGTLQMKENVWAIKNNGNLTLGTNQAGKIGATNTPVIIGGEGSVGISNDNSATFTFYGGTVKGKNSTNKAIENAQGTVTPEGYMLYNTKNTDSSGYYTATVIRKPTVSANIQRTSNDTYELTAIVNGIEDAVSTYHWWLENGETERGKKITISNVAANSVYEISVEIRDEFNSVIDSTDSIYLHGPPLIENNSVKQTDSTTNTATIEANIYSTLAIDQINLTDNNFSIQKFDYEWKKTKESTYEIKIKNLNSNGTFWARLEVQNINGQTDDHDAYFTTQPMEYTITFHSNDGTNKTDTQVFIEDSTGTLKTPFSRNGYTLKNWTTNSNGLGTSYTPGGGYEFTDDTELYAQWKPNTYYIKYHGNGATNDPKNDLMPNSTHTYDDESLLSENKYERKYSITYKLKDETNSEHEETSIYNFEGWAKSAEGPKEIDNKAPHNNLSSTDGETINLYAKWTGGSVTYIPFRAGYAFKGWYEDEECISNKISEEDGVITTPNKNMIVYAKWEARTDTSYTVEYYYQQDNGTYTEEPTKTDKTRYGTTNAQVTLTNEDKIPESIEGKAYVIDETKDNVFSGNIKEDGSLKLKIYFKQQYTISYKIGEHGTFEEKTTTGLDYNADTPQAPSPITCEDGYRFTKWNPEPQSKVTSSINYVAEWKTIEYNIHYDLSEGDWAGQEYQSSYNVETESFTLLKPKRTGYTFVGWTGSNNEDTPEIDVTISKGTTGEKSYKANWKANTYKLVFDNNTGEGTMEAQQVTYDSPFTIKANEFTKVGYSFTGWKAQINEQEKSFENEQTVNENLVAEQDAEVRLYAQWKINKYTLTFDANEGTVSPNEITEDYDTEIDLPTPTRNYTINFNTNEGNEIESYTFNYKFEGWYTGKETGEIKTYEKMPPYDEDLFARWSGEAYTLPIPTKIGYNFVGWYTNQNLEEGKLEETYIPDNDITLYAKWEARTDTTYTVNHYRQDLNGAYPDSLKEVEEKQGTTDTQVTPETKTYTGFTSPTEKKEITVTGDGTAQVNYYYTRNKYYYILGENPDISTEGSTQTGEYYYEAPIILKAEVDHAHTFVQWKSSNTNLVSNQTLAETTIKMPAGDISMTPETKVRDFTLTFDANGGEVDQESITEQYNAKVTLPTPIRSHKVTFETNGGTECDEQTVDYDFLGWYTKEDKKVTYDKMPDHNETLYAKWNGKGFTLPTPTRENYKFVGWYTDKDYENKITTQEYLPTEDTTLYARWVEKEGELIEIQIRTEPHKINYIEGQTFDPKGMEILAIYSNKQKKIITDYTYEPIEKLTLDTNEITITYTENGITKDVALPITVVEKSKAVINYDIRKPTKKNVTVTVEASQEIVDYIADYYEEWEKSADGRYVYRVFTKNGKDDITVTLKDGEEYQFDVEVQNIDKTALKPEVTYDYDSEKDEVTVEVELNHSVDDVLTEIPDGWKLSEDGKKLTKKFKENTEEELTIVDELENKATIDINVTQIGSNKQEDDDNKDDDESKTPNDNGNAGNSGQNQNLGNNFWRIWFIWKR